MISTIILCTLCDGKGYNECSELVDHHKGDYDYWNEECKSCAGHGRRRMITETRYEILGSVPPMGKEPEVEKVCPFDVAYAGSCGKPVREGSYCQQHTKDKCWQCGEQAIRTCSHTSQFVCGMPMCADHNHLHGLGC